MTFNTSTSIHTQVQVSTPKVASVVGFEVPVEPIKVCNTATKFEGGRGTTPDFRLVRAA